MKRLILIAIISSLGFCLKAQDYVPTKADLDAFLKTTTLVVLEENPLLEYNVDIKDVIEKEWKITPFEFIQYKDFDAKRKDPKYSFIMATDVRFEADKTDAKYKFLNLFLGGNYGRLNEMPNLAAIPMAFRGVDESSYIYKLGILVRFMQNHINLIIKNPDIISANIFKYYNKNMGDMKQKTLYITEKELAKEVNSEKRISAIYKHKFKIVTQDEIEEAIKNSDDNVVFLHKVGPEGTKLDARCYKVIIGAADAKFYYFDYHHVSESDPDGFLPSDFKKLERKLKN
jgi:hypothetical protein